MQVFEAPRVGPSMRVLTQKLVGDVRLVLQVAGRPTNDEIAQHIAEAVAMASSVRAVLVIAYGPDAAGPDAGQRAKMARAGMLRVPTAVVTESVLARRIMTAVSWIGRAPIRAFSPDQLFRAYDFLQIAAPVRARIPPQLEAMKAELGVKPIAPVRSKQHRCRSNARVRAPAAHRLRTAMAASKTPTVVAVPAIREESRRITFGAPAHVVDVVLAESERRKLGPHDLAQIDVGAGSAAPVDDVQGRGAGNARSQAIGNVVAHFEAADLDMGADRRHEVARVLGIAPMPSAELVPERRDARGNDVDLGALPAAVDSGHRAARAIGDENGHAIRDFDAAGDARRRAHDGVGLASEHLGPILVDPYDNRLPAVDLGHGVETRRVDPQCRSRSPHVGGQIVRALPRRAEVQRIERRRRVAPATRKERVVKALAGEKRRNEKLRSHLDDRPKRSMVHFRIALLCQFLAARSIVGAAIPPLMLGERTAVVLDHQGPQWLLRIRSSAAIS